MQQQHRLRVGRPLIYVVDAQAVNLHIVRLERVIGQIGELFIRCAQNFHMFISFM